MNILKLKIAAAIIPIILIVLLQIGSNRANDATKKEFKVTRQDDVKFIKETSELFISSTHESH